jgi:ADP-ribosylglycohydrolase
MPGAPDRFRGVLLGTAVGDSLGLPAEGLSPRRAGRLFRGGWKHRLLPGTGWISDDTDHSVFVAQSLLAHPDSAQRFVRRLAWCLRLWLLSLPAGIGLGTLRAIARLWIGIPPAHSGVRSAGNGPAMRAAPIGACFATQPEYLERYVAAATQLTHVDSRALTGARAVALIAAWCVREEPSARPDPSRFLELLGEAGDDPEWRAVLGALSGAVASDLSVAEFAASLGLADGVSGYVYHTVPVVAYAWYRHFGSFEQTLTSVLDCGGDADTTGAIAGALAGAVVGEGGIPAAWLRGLRDFPRSRSLLREIADRLAANFRGEGGGSSMRPVRYFWPALIPRNLIFLLVVLLHGLRRLLPPY